MPLGRPLLDTLERMCYGGVILDGSGAVIYMNDTAARLVHAEVGVSEPGAGPCVMGDREALKRLLARGDARFRMGGDSWFVIHRGERRSLILHAISIVDPPSQGPHTLLVLIDLADTPLPGAEALQKIFGLTAVEAKLAVGLARGQTLSEIAKAHGVTRATVRTQLGSVLLKTQTHRQAELVSLLARLSILP